MPLHLLGKKSWNVYNSENIARVKRDEAIVAAHEAEVERRMQEHDAARRAAILRGLPPPRTPSPPPAPDFRRSRDDKAVEVVAGGRDRKRRRLAGEDDTDRDIRLARLQYDAATEARDASAGDAAEKRKKPASDAPLFDHGGHVNLFPVDEKAARREEKNAEAEAEAKRKKQELEDQYTMRFANAAGKDGLEKKPWYAGGGKSTRPDGPAPQGDDEEPSKDAWGRPDPGRKVRDAQRVTSADPLAFMKSAQVQLKQAEKDQKVWAEKRYREEQELREAAARDTRHKRPRNGAMDDSELEGFSLDATAKNSERLRDNSASSRREPRHRRRRSRSRSRDRERDTHDRHRHSHRRSHRRERSRSRSRSRSRNRHRGHEKDKESSDSRRHSYRSSHRERRRDTP